MHYIFDLVTLVKTKKIKTQRQLAKQLEISLGKTNEIFNEAIEKGFITKDYNTTNKGNKLLEIHKVDNALIMAAGFGSRFVPMTYDTPKGLLEVFGEVMIERQIEQLLEVGITDITIVVGYLKEKFEYLTDKYNVKLIYNPDYSFKNNISSLFYAQKELKNTYILTSDIYMTRNIYQKFEYRSFYSTTFSDTFTDEWAVNINKDGLITKVNPEGGSNTWAMFGPVFFTKDFSTEIVKLIDDVYKDKISDNWYWEDVYIRNMEKLPLYVKKYSSETIQEFESLEELREFDDSYLVNARSDVLETISEIFEVNLKDITNITTLKEGMTNDSFLFEVNNEKYVFRNPGKGTEKLINREQELNVYKVIKDLNISDEVLYLNPKKGYKITKYIPNSRTINPDNINEVKTSMRILKKLHNSGLKVDHEFDIEERINYYIQLCKSSNAILFKDFKETEQLVRKVIVKLNNLNREKVLSHIDSVPVNFLHYDENKIVLLDWEYSGMADPLIDIAMYVVFQGLQDKEITDLLEIYLERKASEEEINVVYSYISLAGFLWSLWTQYKQTSGEDFGTYGIEQYQYARKYSRIVLNEK